MRRAKEVSCPMFGRRTGRLLSRSRARLGSIALILAVVASLGVTIGGGGADAATVVNRYGNFGDGARVTTYDNREHQSAVCLYPHMLHGELVQKIRVTGPTVRYEGPHDDTHSYRARWRAVLQEATTRRFVWFSKWSYSQPLTGDHPVAKFDAKVRESSYERYSRLYTAYVDLVWENVEGRRASSIRYRLDWYRVFTRPHVWKAQKKWC